MLLSLLRWLVLTAVDIYVFLIIVYVIFTWVPVKTGVIGRIDGFLETICDPYLKLFRKFIPPVGNIDWSPIVAILVLQLVVRLIF